MKNRCEKKIGKNVQKSPNMNPLGKPVWARNGKSENVSKLLERAIARAQSFSAKGQFPSKAQQSPAKASKAQHRLAKPSKVHSMKPKIMIFQLSNLNAQKVVQKSILGPILASKTSPKSKENRWKIDVKTRCEKNAKKVPTWPPKKGTKPRQDPPKSRPKSKKNRWKIEVEKS